MSQLVFRIDEISELALQVMQAILSKEDEAKEIMQDASGSLTLASALSDFFQIASALDMDSSNMDSDDWQDFASYGLSLLDRQSYLVRQLELMDQRPKVVCVIPSLAVWLVRHQAVIDNLEGTADGFGMIVNGLNEPKELAEMCLLMDEVIEATSERLQFDEDRSNTWRPWRVINLNSGIAATRSLDAELMECIFAKLSQRLPYDMPSFFADGKKQMMLQNVPDEVKAVMDRYAEKWSNNRYH